MEKRMLRYFEKMYHFDIRRMGRMLAYHRMTQEELAEQICCKKSLISQYENDKVDIKGSVIVELAEFLGTTTGYLLKGEMRCDLDDDEKEVLELIAMLKNPTFKKVALEQVRALVGLNM